MDKIKYTCKNCGWSCDIIKEWSDLKPRRCMNDKCNTSFILDKESLIITLPGIQVENIVLLEEQDIDKEDKKDGKTSNKRK